MILSSRHAFARRLILDSSSVSGLHNINSRPPCNIYDICRGRGCRADDATHFREKRDDAYLRARGKGTSAACFGLPIGGRAGNARRRLPAVNVALPSYAAYINDESSK